eukprot:gb/GFBE01033768.1/.p1 GENE.gb/GFBE01033768.1/~~gb/GFBE01033768.1/.p1  ORF type:complete len:330 (+),score=39.20 gb/GFBE01033768.1/:1-990(+)
MSGGSSRSSGQEAPSESFIIFRRLLRRCVRCLSTACALVLDCLDLVLRIVGPLFVLLALSIIGFVSYIFFTVFVPHIADNGTPFMVLLVEVVIACFLLVNLIYNYLMSICTSPGQPPEYPENPEDLDDTELGDWAKRPKQCRKCDRLKPPRTHHCSVCNRCVLKMDHHCPWINNCVGYKNYRYFLLFMLYLALSCLYVTIMGFSLFMQSFMRSRKHKGGLSYIDMQCVSLSWLISLCIFLALCCLGGFHAYLVLTNQTTIEFHTNLSRRNAAKRTGDFYRNPYDLGSVRNFQEVFGPNKFCKFTWMMPYIAKRPAGDGMSFPMVSEMKM